MARTTFSGPVASTNGFEGNVTAVNATITNTLTLATPATASNAAAFSATRVVAIKGADGNTYYVAAAAASW